MDVGGSSSFDLKMMSQSGHGHGMVNSLWRFLPERSRATF